MKKEEIVDQFLDKALQYLESAEAFTTREVPLYVEELLNYAAFKESAYLILFLVLTAATFFILVMTVKDQSNMEDKLVCGAIIGLLSLIPVLFTINSAHELYKIKYAPRVYLVEYLKK